MPKKLFTILITASILLSAGIGSMIWLLDNSIEQDKLLLVDSLDQLTESINQELNERDRELTEKASLLKELLQKTHEADSARITQLEATLAEESTAFPTLKEQATQMELGVSDIAVDIPELYERTMKAAVQISWQDQYLGSGFIVSFKSAYGTYEKRIVTSYELIEPVLAYVKNTYPMTYAKATYFITLYDGRTVRGNMYAIWQKQGIAVLSFTPFELSDRWSTSMFEPLLSLSIEEPDSLKPGDRIFIIGSPVIGEENRLGLRSSITAGVVSQVNRWAEIDNNHYSNMIQLDAAVNYGSFGSVLLNTKGRVVGIVLARINPAIGQGIGWAIATDQLLQAATIMTTEQHPAPFGYPAYEYKRPNIGITVEDLFPSTIAEGNNAIFTGVRVTEVTPTAAKSGFTIGDIITSIEDHSVSNSEDFYAYIMDNYEAGNSLEFHVEREDQTTIIITIN